MAEHPTRPEIRLQLTLLDSDQVEIWSREPMPVDQLVRLLRKMAHGFERGKAYRIR